MTYIAASRDGDSEQGSVLGVVLVLVVLMAGLTLAFHQLTFTYHQASAASRDREGAYQQARSGAGYFLAELASDSTYLDTLTKPLPEITTGDGSFALETVSKSGDRWDLTVVGRQSGAEYRLGVAMGFAQVGIPGGIVLGGTGAPSDQVLNLKGSSTIASYHPDDGPYNPSSPGKNGGTSVHGSVKTQGGSTIYGDLDATGSVSDKYAITGTATAGATVASIEDIDPIVDQIVTNSKSSNDNATLSTIFGSDFTPVAGSENYGDLLVKGGNYVIPAGTYRFRRFEVTNKATITFDNSGGETNLVYMGMGKGTGSGNDLIVSQSVVQVDSPSASNVFRTILADDCDFRVSQKSVFGQNIKDPDASGYTQIISTGGNGSSDEIELSQVADVYGRLYAAAHDLILGSNGQWFGSGVMRTLSISGGVGGPAGFYIDEDTLGKSIPNPDDFEIHGIWSQN